MNSRYVTVVLDEPRSCYQSHHKAPVIRNKKYQSYDKPTIPDGDATEREIKDVSEVLKSVGKYRYPISPSPV